MSLPPRAHLHQPRAWRVWREAAPWGAVGGSDLARLLGCYPFKGAPAQGHADQGHALEPLILARLHAFLTALGHDVPPFEQGWVAERTSDLRDRGSLDGLALRGGVPVAIGEAKAVFLGQRFRWKGGTPHARADGLTRYVEAQALWYADLVGVPVYVAALMLPCFDLGDMPAAAAIHLGALQVWTIHPDETVEARAAVRDCVAAWREAGCPDDVPSHAEFAAEAKPRLVPGSFDDAVLLARFDDARRRVEAASDELVVLKTEIRARVGDQRGLVAGGRIATVDRRGAVRVRLAEPAEGVEP